MLGQGRTSKAPLDAPHTDVPGHSPRPTLLTVTDRASRISQSWAVSHVWETRLFDVDESEDSHVGVTWMGHPSETCDDLVIDSLNVTAN